MNTKSIGYLAVALAVVGMGFAHVHPFAIAIVGIVGFAAASNN